MASAPEDDDLRSPLKAQDPAAAEHSAKWVAEALTKMGLVDGGTLDVTLDRLSPSADATALADELEKAGQITQLQADLVRTGRSQEIRFDDYVLMEKIGEGGMGEVFKARNVHLGRIEAIKMLHPMSNGEALTRRFQQEARVLARLEHPAIVPIYKIGRVHQNHFIAMKFVQGQDLRGIVVKAKQDGAPIKIQTACQWISDVAQALAYTHEQNVIHRDIKPNNLMLTREGRIIVLDLGIARIADPDGAGNLGQTMSGRGLGTPDFMPPEQWKDASAVTPQADLYALGGTLYFLLTGRVPYKGHSPLELMTAHARDPIPRASEYRADVPPALDSVIFKMMAKEPNQRYASATEVVEALAPFINSSFDSDASHLPVKEPVDDQDPPPNRLLAFSAAVVVALALVAGGVSWWRSAEQNQHVPNNQPIVVSPTEIKPEPNLSSTTGARLEDLLKQKLAQFPESWDSVDEMKRELKGDTADLAAVAATLDELAPARQQQRWQERATTWLDAHRARHRALWTADHDWERVATPQLVQSKKDFEELRRGVEAETLRLTQPFEDLQSNVMAADKAKLITGTLQKLMQLQATPPDPDWQLDAWWADDQRKRLDRARVRQKMHLVCRVNRTAHITGLSLDVNSCTCFSVSQSRNEEGINAGREVFVQSTISFDEPGVERLFLFATEANLFPASQPLPNFVEEGALIPKLFSSERVFERIRRSLETGQPMPGVAPSTTPTKWTRALLEIVIDP